MANSGQIQMGYVFTDGTAFHSDSWDMAEQYLINNPELTMWEGYYNTTNQSGPIADGVVVKDSNSNIYILRAGTDGSIEMQEDDGNPAPGGEIDPQKHDRQKYVSDQAITSGVDNYSDIPGCELTTRSLGENGNYVIDFNVELSANGYFKVVYFRLLKDGVAVPNSVYTTNTVYYMRPTSFQFKWNVNDVGAGSVFKIQWKPQYNSTIMASTKRKLIIDGVPKSKVMEV